MSSLERVLLRDALAYLQLRTGLIVERRTAQRWAEAGRVSINQQVIIITTTQVMRRWFITRASLDEIVAALALAE